MSCSDYLLDFEDIKEYIIGSYYISDYFKATVCGDYYLNVGQYITVDKSLFKITHVEDVTTEEEYEQGLSYNLVFFTKE